MTRGDLVNSSVLQHLQKGTTVMNEVSNPKSVTKETMGRRQQDRQVNEPPGLRGHHDQRVDGVKSWEVNHNAVNTDDLISFRSPDKELRGPHNSGQGAQATAQVLADTAMKLRSGPQSAQDTSQVLADTVRRLTALLSTLTPDGSIY